MTNQKKTELINYFDLVWTKNPQFQENVLKMEAIFSQNSPQNRILETSIRYKNSEKGPTFSSKIPERVDIETIKWHTPVRKYHEFLPGICQHPKSRGIYTIAAKSLLPYITSVLNPFDVIYAKLFVK